MGISRGGLQITLEIMFATKVEKNSGFNAWDEYYNAIYHNNTTTFVASRTTLLLGNKYIETAGQTDIAPATVCFSKPKAELQENSNTVRLNITPRGINYLPFLHYKKTAYNKRLPLAV